jgi:hypothetical protein
MDSNLDTFLYNSCSEEKMAYGLLCVIKLQEMHQWLTTYLHNILQKHPKLLLFATSPE